MARRDRDERERTRRRFVRRQWTRRWLAWRPVLALVVLLALVAGGVYAVYFSSWLEVEGVEVTGTTSLDAATVERRAAVPTGEPLATVDLAAIERRVSTLAPVAEVDATRQWPHDVLITITEREPVAVLSVGGSLRAVDETGAIFGAYAERPDDLPLIQGSAADGEALREAATVAAALPPEIASLTDHLSLAGPDRIELALRDGRTVRWGTAEASAEKAEVLLALLGQEGDVYDVSVPGLPTVS